MIFRKSLSPLSKARRLKINNINQYRRRTNCGLKISGYTALKVFLGVFVVRIFPHSGCMRRDAEYLSVFNPNTGIYKHFSRSASMI